MLKILVMAVLVLGSASFAHVAAQHEYAPLEEKTVNYKDWTFKDLKDGSPVNLRKFAQGKKLVMVVYFAPWCGNWKLEAPVAKSLYAKYHQYGLEMVGVSEYGPLDDTRNFFNADGPGFTVVSESDSRDAREKTTHFGYRKLTGDSRTWGSPWNIFLVPSKLNADGEVLTDKAFVVNGELVEADVDKFIREHLGLDPKTASVTLPGPPSPCEPPKTEATFKKP